MSTDQGRRVLLTASARRTAVLGAVMVALTAGMLLLAGTTPREIGRAVEDPSRVQLDSRTFTCTGGIEGSTLRSGSLREGPSADRKITDGSRNPITIVADRDVAPGSFAGQQAASTKSLAWLPCPEPAAHWWFVGAGGAENTHATVLTIVNPREGEASIDIEVFGPSGPVEAPGLRDLPVPPQGSRVIDLARTAPALGNLAVRVNAKRGLVAVTAADRYAPGSVGRFAREWLPPQSLPARSLTLAGIPTDRRPTGLVVANPGDVEAIVKVEVIGQTGTFAPESLPEFTVGPGSVKTISVTSLLDGTPMALRVVSEQRVTATLRSVKNDDSSFATGVQVIRGATAFALPDGNARLLLSSVGEGGTVRLIAFGSGGRELAAREHVVGAGTTLQVALPAGTRYVRLVAPSSSIVAGFVVTSKAGTAAAGVGSALRSVRLPKVLPGW